MSTPRIVLLANNVEELGGAQRVVHVLAQGLAARGYPVEVVGIVPFAPEHRFHDQPRYPQTTLLEQPLPKPAPDNRLSTRLNPSVAARMRTRERLRAEAVARLRAHLAAGEPGLIVCAQVWAMEHLAQAGYAGWSVIGQYHSSYAAASAGRDLPRILDSYADVDALTLLTEADARAFAGHGLQNTVVQRNPLAFWPADVPSARPQTITYLGRLSAEKGPSLLLDAWSRIPEARAQWRLQFVGDGPQADQLRARGVPGAEFLPATANPEQVLAATSILTLPSLVEGSPLSLAEAMACGVACVAADCSDGVRELVLPGRTGLLVDRGDAAALAAALEALMADGALRQRLGAAARRHVEDRRLDQVLDEWEALIAWTLR